VGGETLRKSAAVLKRGGIVVSIVEKPDEAALAASGLKSAYLFLEPDQRKLGELARLVGKGLMRPVISGVFPLEEARRAHEISEGHHLRGKLVLRVR
jgi:NADPH:quinone reductase-like Zn-dependent oxidoreductase